MRFGLKTLITGAAFVVLGGALLAPIAGAARSGAGMMGGGTGTTTVATPGSMMGGDTGPIPGDATGTWCGGGIWSGTGAWGGTGMWGMGSGMAWLTDNPAAMQAWLQLRADHMQDMQTWYDTYKADPTSAQAQAALHDLWTKNWNDMKAFYQQYAGGTDWTSPANGMWGGWMMGSMMGGGSWNPGHMWGSGYGASWMTGHAAGMGRWLAMRSGQVSVMNAWWQQHSADPASASAQAALKTLMGRQRTQVKHFYRQHHLSTSSAMMSAGAGGWMGLGGMWGGFGW